MEKLEDKSNSDLEMAKKSLMNEYETLKNKMLKDCDKLDELAARYGKATRILNSRNV